MTKTNVLEIEKIYSLEKGGTYAIEVNSHLTEKQMHIMKKACQKMSLDRDIVFVILAKGCKITTAP